MAAVTSNLFDAIPTPITLKEQSAFVISLNIWRREIENFRRGGELKRMRPCGPRELPYLFNDLISLETIFPGLPPVIRNIIDGYVTRFGNSMADWLNDNHKKIFRHEYNSAYDILRHFDDFVGDGYGIIDYVKTAERMMRCDRFSEIVKFQIACTYFFEDDITRIWPSVSPEMVLPTKKRPFSKFPQVYYWVCRLSNQLHQIQIRWMGDSVDEIMFDVNMPRNGPSVEYFWNRIPFVNRLRKAKDLYKRDTDSFVRFILPKLNDQQLDTFVNENGYHLMWDLLKSHQFNAVLILPTWMRVKNVMKENIFANLAAEILRTEAFCFASIDEPKNFMYYCIEIWNSAPYNLKQSALKSLLSGKRLREIMGPTTRISGQRSVEFLLLVLSCASLEEKSEFCRKFWHYLIARTQIEDLRRIMNLCFENEDEIAQFKEHIANSDCLLNVCVACFKYAALIKLNDLMSFYFPETNRANTFKEQLLRTALFSDDFSLIDTLSPFGKLDQFIKDGDLSTDFKNQIMTSPVIQHKIILLASSPLDTYRNVAFRRIVKFIETFSTTEQIVLEMKNRILDAIKENFTADVFIRPSPILAWCLGSEEEVKKFQLDRTS
ncbi:uncharacterized protein LOC135848253 isoform X17 [Planococcus citri]|uniref:uncharacterized protein LOC135848253 isoform X17 n=1 Tax=Planococcus citri TaxID=170843 RepID=UPI0031FA1181